MSGSRKLVAASVILASFAFLFSTSTAYTQTIEPVDELRVFDANGNEVGKVLTIEGLEFPLVAFRLDGHLVVLAVLRDSLEGGDFLFFESTGCSGTPFLLIRNPDAIERLARAATVPPGTTVWVRDPDGAIQTVTVRSQLVPSRFTPSCQNIGPNTTQAVPALGPLVNLDEVFTPPFSVR